MWLLLTPYHYNTLVYFLRKIASILDQMTQKMVLISSKSLKSIYMKIFEALLYLKSLNFQELS